MASIGHSAVPSKLCFCSIVSLRASPPCWVVSRCDRHMISSWLAAFVISLTRSLEWNADKVFQTVQLAIIVFQNLAIACRKDLYETLSLDWTQHYYSERFLANTFRYCFCLVWVFAFEWRVALCHDVVTREDCFSWTCFKDLDGYWWSASVKNCSSW